MTSTLAGLRIGPLEPRHLPGHRGSLIAQLLLALGAHGALVDVDAFPGHKGTMRAPEAIAAEIARRVAQGGPA